MKNKLLLSLWLLGAVLYTGSSVFLANTLLGGVGGHADKAKPTTIATADAQCQKASASDGGDKSAKTASVQPQKPEPAAKPAPQKPTEATAPADHSTSAAADPVQEPSDQGPSPEETQDADASASDGAPPPDGGQQEEASIPDGAGGAGPDQPEREEWARVVASTADMRSDPARDAALIYALPSGWQVRVISRSNGWVQIQDANSGAAGWVEASALAPGEQQGQGYGGAPPPYGPGYGPPPRYAGEGYPPDPTWRPRYERRGQFADFLRRALGGY